MGIWKKFRRKDKAANDISEAEDISTEKEAIIWPHYSPGRGRLTDDEKNLIETRILQHGYNPKQKSDVYNMIAEELKRNPSTVRSHLARKASDVSGKMKRRPNQGRKAYSLKVKERIVKETELPHVTVKDVAFWYNLSEQRVHNWKQEILGIEPEKDLDFHESEILDYFNAPPALSVDNLEVHINQVQNLMIKLLPIIKDSEQAMTDSGMRPMMPNNPKTARRHLVGIFENAIRDIDKYRYTFYSPLTATELFQKLRGELGEEEAIRRLLKDG